MNRAGVLLLVGALLLWACEPTPLPPPEIVSVEPAELEEAEGVEVRIQFEALLRASLDYEQRTVESARSELSVLIAGRPVPIERIEKNGVLVLRVPADLPPGEHDIELILSDGRATKREKGLTVKEKQDAKVPTTPDTVAPGDAGTPLEQGNKDGGSERSGISGFQFDTIDDQVSDVPFTIVIRAQGLEASAFQDSVTLSSNKGVVLPETVGPFVNGVAEVQVTISQPGAGMVLTATDADGNQGDSNEFKVRPH